MASPRKTTTPHGPSRLLAAYESVVALATAELASEARTMRAAFEARTGAFGPEDPWFEPRSRAFWDDAVTVQGFAALASAHLAEDAAALVEPFGRAHRGLFTVEDCTDRGALLLDLWSGAELLVRHLDDAQAMTFEHAEGPMDARVVAGPARGELYVLPGALHHGSDALEPIRRVIDAAHDRDMSTPDALDALLRMELVFRRSSRVKAAFAYRIEGLSPAKTRAPVV